jgi:hypothetical protein
MTEQWAGIPGYIGHYEVSSIGRVRSLSREVPVLNGPRSGRVVRRPGKLMSPVTNRAGHHQIQLIMHKRRVTHSVHRLMMLAFVGGGEGMEACHRNGIHADNRLENLYWGTHSDNILDSVQHGTHNMARRTHCPEDHPYDEANTIRKGGHRSCRECGRKSARERMRAVRATRRIKTPGPVDGPVRRRKVGQCCVHTFKHHTASGGCRCGCGCEVGPK